MNKTLSFFKENRLLISRLVGLIIIALLLFSKPTITADLTLNLILWSLSFILVLVCAFGRLWTLAYISGNKTMNLIEVGPYSMVRNPLYLFSLIGAIGIGIASRNLPVLGLIVALFAFYYPFVIRAEEANLSHHHGASFEEFKARVPMFWPRFSQYQVPEYYEINTRLHRRSFFSACWFPLIYMAVVIIAVLHDNAILPVLF
jgi:protein-S-isoprenylcysteine O-methyltransferase Ste14